MILQTVTMKPEVEVAQIGQLNTWKVLKHWRIIQSMFTKVQKKNKT